ncbi:MAG TPA: tetratricopeptide repeat protein [Polyangia bacterium]|jgi:tetratricopeptide (TPR) repeat protein|nr:tetratricopeptide repeat protein [Polyangia bacterium]
MRETSAARGGFFGREAELATLDAALARAVRFEAPQMVTVVGTLGFGKTRLLAEWLASKADAGVRLVRATAARADGGVDAAPPRALLAALLRDRFQLEGAPDAAAALAWFRAELQRVFGDRRVAEVASLLGGFLGFEMAESPLVQALVSKPEQGAALARAVLCRFLEQDARERPLVIVAEDLQDADEASLELLADLGGELGEAPILLVVTARPDLLVRRPSWGRTAGSSVRLELAPLPRRTVDAFIRATLGTDELAPALVDRAVVESGGSPYLLEQLLTVYRQHGILVAETGEGRSPGWSFDAERAARANMALTGEEAAEMRVAALTPAERDVLARGAVFGGVFWTGGVVALGRLGGAPADESAVFAPDPAIAEIKQTLERLEARDYLERLPESVLDGETAWGFRRALEQTRVETGVDPALGRRRRLFAAQWLESRIGVAREQRLEALAHLYEGAGDARRAAYCFITAAAEARARLLLDRAHVLYAAAVRLLDVDDAVAKMDALYALGDVAARLGRTREALGHFGEMLRLAWRLDLPAKGGAAHGRIGRLHGTLGAPKQAILHLELARTLFEVAGDAPGVAAALDDIGRIHFLTGAPEASLACHRAALALREQLGDERGRALALARMGQVEHEAGALEAAGAHFREALALRRKFRDKQGEIASLLDLGGLELDLGRVEAAVALLDEGRMLAREQGECLFEASIGIELGECHLSQGQPRLARKEYDGAREIARQFGARLLLSEALRGLAEAELALGDLRRARDDARSAFEIAERIGAAPLVGAALRVVAASVGFGAPGEADLGGAREMFDRAVEVLSNAGAELELARTLAAYSEFEARVGRRDTAAELLRQAALIRDRSRHTGRRRPSEDAALLALASP